MTSPWRPFEHLPPVSDTGRKSTKKDESPEDLNKLVNDLDRRDVPLPGTPWKLVDYILVGNMYKFAVEIAPGQYIEVKEYPHATIHKLTTSVRRVMEGAPRRSRNPIPRLNLPPLWTINIYRRGHAQPELIRVKHAYGEQPHDVMPAVTQYLRQKGWTYEKAIYFHKSLRIDVLMPRNTKV